MGFTVAVGLKSLAIVRWWNKIFFFIVNFVGRRY